MTIEATIYARFSNAEQAAGSSLDRQFRHCEEMASRHGWTLAPDRMLSDEGVSAYSGANRKPGGRLHDFEQQVSQGLYAGGHVLIVENFDRISRRGYEEVLAFINHLTINGVTVATVDGDRIFPAGERVPMAPVIEVILKAELALEESQKKAKRLAAAWQRKLDMVQAGDGNHIAHTKTVPAWINVDPSTMKMSLNGDRCRVLREIFQMTIDGHGTPSIAKALNSRGEAVWEYRGRTSNHGWTVGYLTKLVLNRAVMGEFRPVKKPRGLPPEERGIIVLNHFPQAIDPDTFAKAMAARAERRGTSGAWKLTHENVLSGIAKCGACGGRMRREVTVRKGDLRRNGHGAKFHRAGSNFSYLQCDNARFGVHDQVEGRARCSQSLSIRYEPLEKSVVKLLLGFATANHKDVDTEFVRSVEAQIAELRRQAAGKREQAETTAVSFSKTGSPTLETLLLRLEEDARVLDKQIAGKTSEVERARGRASSIAAPSDALTEWSLEMTKLEDQIWSDELPTRQKARIKFNQLARRYISRFECDGDKISHVVLGEGSVIVSIGPDGSIVENAISQPMIIGPEGQADWHPDVAG